MQIPQPTHELGDLSFCLPAGFGCPEILHYFLNGDQSLVLLALAVWRLERSGIYPAFLFR
jgi:hypothetical protein